MLGPLSSPLAPLALVATLTAAGMAFGQNGIELTPTLDAAGEIRIPADLEDALAELRVMLPPMVLERMRSAPEEHLVLHHSGLGMWIRNNWGLWRGSPLREHLKARGLSHPDDMSAVILTCLWRQLHARPLEVETQVRYYQAYWKAMEAPEDLGCPACKGKLKLESSRMTKAADGLPVGHHDARCSRCKKRWTRERENGWKPRGK